MSFLPAAFSLALRAHLEGDRPDSFLSQINSDYLMANWYKIVLAVVLGACVIGLIIGNVRYLVKKIRHKSK